MDLSLYKTQLECMYLQAQVFTIVICMFIEFAGYCLDKDLTKLKNKFNCFLT